jgi:hypothetical protein
MQACENAAEWPFRQIAEAAARLKPELVIHVGDYHYLESPCSDPPKCGTGEYGDVWRTWEREFFEPATPLLRIAPWIMLRGNHEDCLRAGAGWFFLLWPQTGGPPATGCNENSEPYYVRFDNVAVAVLDTAHAGDGFRRAQRAQYYEMKLAGFLKAVAGQLPSDLPIWLALHQPLWGSWGNRSDGSLLETDPFQDIAHAMQPVIEGDAWKSESKSVIDAFAELVDPLSKLREAVTRTALVLSGDTHAFEAFMPTAADHPVQIVAGTGGDALEKTDMLGANPTMAEQAMLFGQKGTLWGKVAFGFVMLTNEGHGWIATLYDTVGASVIRCDLSARRCD